ncbi:MAG: hypothetical protein WBN40_10545, partial [Pseudomonadales bacterium]
ELAQIAQRVSVEYHIDALGWQETANYIRHRLITAALPGNERQASRAFDSVAMAVIFYFSGGVPRLINTLCDIALVHAYAIGLQTINYKVALEVVGNRKIGGVNRFVKNTEQLVLVRKRVLEAVGFDLATALDSPRVDTSGTATANADEKPAHTHPGAHGGGYS